jgi:Sulfotransferase domain
MFIERLVLARGEPKTLEDRGAIWHHIAAWWPRRHDTNVLWLHYEDLVEARVTDHATLAKVSAHTCSCRPLQCNVHSIVPKPCS